MKIFAADLFAGAGGASTGLRAACAELGADLDLVAVNHWPTAIATHSRNHPEARHYCAPVEAVDPRAAVPGGRLDLLIAAPECTHHSCARGGRPVNDQSRASAWHVLRWLELLRVDRLLIENVPDFLSWAPLGSNNRPLKSKRGQTFRAYIAAIESYNMRVEWRKLNSADYGEATTRTRLFIQAVRGRAPIVWPSPTHSPAHVESLFGKTARWRPAREVIDWSLPSVSILDRKKPLAPATMARVLDGLRRQGVQPFLLGQQSGSIARPVTEPTPTISTDGAIALVEPYLAKYYGTGITSSVSEPVPTIATKDRFGLVQPVVVDGRVLDIRYRMLQPHELAAAMGFPASYQFTGNKGEQTKQIGNAISVRTMAALCRSALEDRIPARSLDMERERTA